MEENKDIENLKFERTASKKYVYSFKLLGTPEDNLKRLTDLQVKLDTQIKELYNK